MLATLLRSVANMDIFIEPVSQARTYFFRSTTV
jgi:hypothetical protein